MLIIEGREFYATANEIIRAAGVGWMEAARRTCDRAGASVRIVRGWGWRACSLLRTKDLKWGQTRLLTGNMRKGGNNETSGMQNLVQWNKSYE